MSFKKLLNNNLIPASPNNLCLIIVSTATRASLEDLHSNTPLPAASPSAFTTSGQFLAWIYFVALSAEVKILYSAVGSPYFCIISFEKDLLPSNSAALALGPKIEPLYLKSIYDPHYKRLFWTNPRQPNFFLHGKLQQTFYIVCRDRNVISKFTCSCLPGAQKIFSPFWTLFYLPNQCMFASTTSNNQNPHILSLESMYNYLENLYKMPSCCNSVSFESTKMLKLESVSKSFGEKLFLKNISLEIREGGKIYAFRAKRLWQIYPFTPYSWL
ncbi:MAG: hypothetical protein CM1200mP16_16090 [Nitrospina sp.]|nr:MAG: hypothetical protein CM1200mP16_16090 [Nitrospina sp.]